jgi:uncharacterized SAM-binding protein YcdF (DUF218 family)
MMLTTLIKTLLLPPALPLLMIFAGLLVWSRYRYLARMSVFSGIFILWALSLPVVSAYLHQGLESDYVAETPSVIPDGIQAIVVLGAGRHYGAGEYGGDTLSHSALWRLRYGAYLAKRWNLPVLVSGGNVRPFDVVPEAEMGVNFLRNELNVDVAWAETQSRNTWENAQLSASFLAKKNIYHVALVTHAYHMPRSVHAFQQAGLTVAPMPTGQLSQQSSAAYWLNWLPSTNALNGSHSALHEYLGLLFYSIKSSIPVI